MSIYQVVCLRDSDYTLNNIGEVINYSSMENKLIKIFLYPIIFILIPD